jgi:hypothetical protein
MAVLWSNSEFYDSTICWNSFSLLDTWDVRVVPFPVKIPQRFKSQSAGNQKVLENVENLFNLDQPLVGSSETKRASSSNEDADFGDWLIYYDTSWKGYNYVVCSRKELDVFMEYFSKYPLKTLKHVDYISFRRLLLFLERNYHHQNHPNKVIIDNLIRLFKQRNKR